VGGVVIEDQMQIEMGSDLVIDLLEEGHEFVCPMSGQTFADDFAGRDVERGKSVVVPLRLKSSVMVPARPFFKGSAGSDANCPHCPT
jgi:hypothetical protein